MPYLKYISIALSFFLIIVLYVLEFAHFNNTFNVESLILIAMLIGLIIGSSIAYLYKNQAKDYIEQFQIFSIFIASGILIMPLFASLTNRLLSFQSIRQERVELFKIEPFIVDRFGILEGETIEPDGYYIFFIRNDELKRIKTTELLFVDKKVGDLIEIPVLKGLWTYEVVLL